VKNESSLNDLGTSAASKAADETPFSLLGLRGGGERLISLFMTVERLLSEKRDMNAALDTLLYYMKKDLGVVKGLISLIHTDSGKLLLSRSLGFGYEEEERLLDSILRLDDQGPLKKENHLLSRRSWGGFAKTEETPAIPEPSDLALVTVPIIREGKILGNLSTLSRFPDFTARKRHETHLSVMASLFSSEAGLYIFENVDRLVLEKKVRTLSSEIYELKERYSPSNLVSSSSAMQEVYFLLRKVASRRTIVLILGEKGVEKETVAQSIHYDGLKAMGPFVKINCLDFPSNLLEDELFGPEGDGERGLKRGLFEAADGGSIFIDEIDRCPLSLQARILEFLKERSPRSPASAPALDARIIAGASRDLRELAGKGLFLEELFYRLNVFPINIPPLRKREEDIDRLARHFLARFGAETGKNQRGLSPAALEILRGYDWPGNVEELEAAIHLAAIAAERNGGVIEPGDLPREIRLSAAPRTQEPLSLEERLSSIEEEMISEALKRHRGNISQAARELRLTRRSMGLRMKRLKLNYKDFRA
jgi:Nif-specific regulatory protein